MARLYNLVRSIGILRSAIGSLLTLCFVLSALVYVFLTHRSVQELQRPVPSVLTAEFALEEGIIHGEGPAFASTRSCSPAVVFGFKGPFYALDYWYGYSRSAHGPGKHVSSTGFTLPIYEQSRVFAGLTAKTGEVVFVAYHKGASGRYYRSCHSLGQPGRQVVQEISRQEYEHCNSLSWPFGSVNRRISNVLFKAGQNF